MSTPAFADPWTPVNDRLLRSDIELLADYAVIKGGVNSWPMHWSQVAGALRSADIESFPAHVRDAALRVQRQVPTNIGRPSTRAEVKISVTNKPAIIRGYDNPARGDYDVQGRFIGQWGKTSLSLGLGLRDDPFSRTWHLDDSYLAHEVGNWTIYAGTLQQWWGPGWSSALLHSTAARPFPKVGFRRNRPDPFKSKWLSWIGPWSFEAYLGLQDEAGLRFENHFIVGMRLEVQPFNGVTFAFKRAMELCGNDRPCGLETWARGLIVLGDLDNTGTLDEPGNQIAGIDFRYGNTIGKVAYSLYGEIIGEDEDNFIVGVYATLWGARLSGPWGANGSRWDAIVEYSDTQANRSFWDRNFANSIYENFIYQDGWRYRGRSIGASQDNDSRLISITGQLTDTRNRFYRVTLHHADLNTDGTGRHTVSLNAETINILEAETRIPTPLGDLGFTTRFHDDRPNTPNSSKFQASAELSLHFRF